MLFMIPFRSSHRRCSIEKGGFLFLRKPPGDCFESFKVHSPVSIILVYTRSKTRCSAAFNKSSIGTDELSHCLVASSKPCHSLLNGPTTSTYSSGFFHKKHITPYKMKFYIKDFFSKCDQIRSILQIWSHLLKKSLIQNLIFCAVLNFQSF